MAVTLGSETFDERHTAFAESLEEVGGRNERVITVSGVVLGESSLVGVEARLDAIVDAASVEDYSAVLSLRTGRRMGRRWLLTGLRVWLRWRGWM